MKLPPRPICDADPSALSIEQALERIQNGLPRITETEDIDCSNALGRICAQDVISPMSVPSFRASAMDGYAVRAADCENPLRLEGRSIAGHPGTDHMPAQSCQRITTGARVPDDADAVVQQENVERCDDMIVVKVAPHAGLHVRNPGTDSQEGDILLSKGSRIGPSELALLAAHGITHLVVFRVLRIALLSTGDELREPGNLLEPGQIYDANRPLLQAMLASSAVELIDLGICKDSEEALEETLNAASEVDIIISSGGVSVGDADHVRSVLERTGQVDLWKIAMKPGRPLTFGFSRPGQCYFGLPGNPVSAAITALIFVNPSIRYMLGHELPLPAPLRLPVTDSLRKNPGRVEYQRAIMQKDSQNNWTVGTTGLQDSHVLSSLHKANCLIALELNSEGAQIGDQVEVYPFTHFSSPIL
ncbi:gephyrin-like molybdotransferase Glp [Granulosicoccus antarcticus]|uniref:Molybdopterin molybdenumtransferase n=1 Tax=Granulosicoccus antarcticus IMCC3135 TaxID=1192854 RepID=A0A2Z2P347_9GAMM|nr:gephyrin-like molybdotransferase Glp [Granulosicoccus antarcticus]ASJ75047.1 Molybdopterin molybdenumtransferase [Granulosicoccus antarcticus IMCC3135]